MESMERPSKRRCVVSPDTDLNESRLQNDLRLKSTFESIFQKYEKDFTDVGDEVDLETGDILVNNGHLLGMKNEKDVGADENLSGELHSDSIPYSEAKEHSVCYDLQLDMLEAHRDNTVSEASWQSDDTDTDSLIGDLIVDPSPTFLGDVARKRFLTDDTEYGERHVSSTGNNWNSTPPFGRLQPHWNSTSETPRKEIQAVCTDGQLIEPTWRVPPLPTSTSTSEENMVLKPANEREALSYRPLSPPNVSLWASTTHNSRRKHSRVLSSYVDTADESEQEPSPKPKPFMQPLYRDQARKGVPPSPPITLRKIPQPHRVLRHWTQQEDELLFHLMSSTTLAIFEIVERFPGRTINSVRSHWNRQRSPYYQRPDLHCMNTPPPKLEVPVIAYETSMSPSLARKHSHSGILPSIDRIKDLTIAHDHPKSTESNIRGYRSVLQEKSKILPAFERDYKAKAKEKSFEASAGTAHLQDRQELTRPPKSLKYSAKTRDLQLSDLTDTSAKELKEILGGSSIEPHSKQLNDLKASYKGFSHVQTSASPCKDPYAGPCLVGTAIQSAPKLKDPHPDTAKRGAAINAEKSNGGRLQHITDRVTQVKTQAPLATSKHKNRSQTRPNSSQVSDPMNARNTATPRAASSFQPLKTVKAKLRHMTDMDLNLNMSKQPKTSGQPLQPLGIEFTRRLPPLRREILSSQKPLACPEVKSPIAIPIQHQPPLPNLSAKTIQTPHIVKSSPRAKPNDSLIPKTKSFAVPSRKRTIMGSNSKSTISSLFLDLSDDELATPVKTVGAFSASKAVSSFPKSKRRKTSSY